MAVIEVPMISGFRADVESLERVIITLMSTFYKGFVNVYHSEHTKTYLDIRFKLLLVFIAHILLAR